MKLNELQPKSGSRQNTKRVGRGIGSGKGKTCGVGQKGQKGRSGVAINGFEGGQMPLYQRLPKRGFNNKFGKNFATISLGRLQQALDKKMIDAKDVIDVDALAKAKIISRKNDGIRLLGNGSIKSKITLKVAGATASAIKAVEKAGGKVEVLEAETKGPRHKSKDADGTKNSNAKKPAKK